MSKKNNFFRKTSATYSAELGLLPKAKKMKPDTCSVTAFWL
jgi:hypothetical protein